MIRPYAIDDAEATYFVYREAARRGSQPHYTPEQGMAWAPSDEIAPWWRERMLSGTTWVWDADRTVGGLISLTRAGHLDMFFVLPELRGTVASGALYDALLSEAKSRGLTELTTDASHLARRFLERRGWQTKGEETVERGGVELTRSQMKLTIS